MEVLQAAVEAIRNEKPRSIVVLTGAGVSADSGIPTFRGQGGLWRNYRAEELATPEAFARNPLLVWEWYEWRRSLVRKAQPNAAHRAVASLDDALVVTQNVDGLHHRAGSRNVIELHGNLFRTRCVREGKNFDAGDPFDVLPPHCKCDALLRPDGVWFGKPFPQDSSNAPKRLYAAPIFSSSLEHPASCSRPPDWCRCIAVCRLKSIPRSAP